MLSCSERQAWNSALLLFLVGLCINKLSVGSGQDCSTVVTSGIEPLKHGLNTCRAKLSLETALSLLVALDLALAVLCITFMARRVNTDIFTWLTSSLLWRPKMVSSFAPSQCGGVNTLSERHEELLHRNCPSRPEN